MGALREGLRVRRRSLGMLGIYLLLSLCLWRSLVPHLATHTLGGGLQDPGLFIWWLKWTPYALTHGMNPFRSTYLDAPVGVSAMWNTSVLALGVVFTPVTLTFGAVTTFNLACILGPPLSAWTAWLWLRRHVHDAAAAIGGLVFGFSPFVIGQSRAGHLMFTWLFLLPLIVMLVEDLLWRADRPVWPRAPLLGVVVAVQLLIGSEALLITVIGCAGLAVALAVSRPRDAWKRLRVLASATGVAVAVGALLCAWPLFEMFGGDRVIRQPVQPLSVYGGNPAMLVGAGQAQLFHNGHGPRGHLTSVENGLYIGWPLLIALVVAAIVLFRHRGVIVAALAIIVSADFQMYASKWHIAGHSVTAPFRIMQNHVALTRNILPGRFAIVMWLAIAWLLAVAIDAVIARLRTTRLRGRWPVVIPAAVAGLVLVPLLPGPQAPTTRLIVTPPLFTTSLVKVIPKGATVMLAPMATSGNNAAQLWQVRANMRFKQVGGYMLHSVKGGIGSYLPAEEALTALFRIDLATGLAFKGEVPAAMIRDARAELRATKATMFLVGFSRRAERKQLEIAEQVLGRPADRHVGGVAIWSLTDRAHA